MSVFLWLLSSSVCFFYLETVAITLVDVFLFFFFRSVYVCTSVLFWHARLAGKVDVQ